MEDLPITPGLQFFGHLVEGEALIADIFSDINRKSFIVTVVIVLNDQFNVFCEI